jgi:hypothetical protein
VTWPRARGSTLREGADIIVHLAGTNKGTRSRQRTWSGLAWTTLRATQFHDLLLLTVRQMARLPVVPVPAGFRFQPVDPGEVAARLVELALGTPAGLVPDLGGPRTYGMAALVRSYLRASGRHRPVAPIWLPGKAARAFRAGANLTPDRAVGRRTWEDFLAARMSSPSDSGSWLPGGPDSRWEAGGDTRAAS